MKTASTFEDLLRAAQLGEGPAPAELWARFSGGVAAFACARGAVDVDEVTSDVFLSVFTKVADFSGDESGFKALLYTIARRRVSDERRKRSRRVEVVAWSPRDDNRTTRSAEDTVVDRDETRGVLAMVDRLTADQRDVVLLRLVADLSIDEVARVLGKRPGSVKSLQRRALDALRRSIATEPNENHPSALTDPRNRREFS